MGREIRRVPAGWEHPKSERYPERYRGLYDEDFQSAATDWMANAVLWSQGKHESQNDDYAQKHNIKEGVPFYWQWAGMPPDQDDYRPAWSDEERTHYQVYETVSEGTPVSPAFATQEALIDYLVENGDFWCQGRPDESPPSREAATAFVKSGWAPSFIMTNGKLKSGVDAAEDITS